MVSTVSSQLTNRSLHLSNYLLSVLLGLLHSIHESDDGTSKELRRVLQRDRGELLARSTEHDVVNGALAELFREPSSLVDFLWPQLGLKDSPVCLKCSLIPKIASSMRYEMLRF